MSHKITIEWTDEFMDGGYSPFNWCIENIGEYDDKWMCEAGYYWKNFELKIMGVGVPAYRDFHFEDETDAMLFALRWIK